MGYRRERAEADTYAQLTVRALPGDYSDNMDALMRIRAQRVRRMRSLGLSSQEIYEAMGLTYRQQHYALRWEAKHAVQG